MGNADLLQRRSLPAQLCHHVCTYRTRVQAVAVDQGLRLHPNGHLLATV